MRKSVVFARSGRPSGLRRAVLRLLPALLLVTGLSAPPAWAEEPIADPPASTTADPVGEPPASTTADPVAEPPASTPTDPGAEPPAPSPDPVPEPPATGTDPVPEPPVTEPDPPAEEPPPSAATLSTNPIASWGTAKNGIRAQRVSAIVEAGGIAYLGGEFKSMVAPDGDTASRPYLAAIDGKTGKLTSWNPRADGKVWAMELSADRQSVYVGGDFNRIGDRSVSKLARIRLADGKVDTSFRPSVKGRVRGLALAGGRLYLGGEFLTVGKQPRPKLAAVDAATGAVLNWVPPNLGPGRYLGQTGIPTPDYSPGHVFAVEAIGGKVFAGGTFIDFGGEGGLVTLDAATGALSGPQYDLGRPIFDLDSSGGILYAVGGGPGGRLWSLDPAKSRPRWSAKFDGDAVGVVTSGGTVYVAGHYDFVVNKKSGCYQYCPKGQPRRHLAAFAASDGALSPWNPTADTSTGPWTVGIGPKNLYAGGEFNKINGDSQPGFAIFPGTP